MVTVATKDGSHAQLITRLGTHISDKHWSCDKKTTLSVRLNSQVWDVVYQQIGVRVFISDSVLASLTLKLPQVLQSTPPCQHEMGAVAVVQCSYQTIIDTQVCRVHWCVEVVWSNDPAVLLSCTIVQCFILTRRISSVVRRNRVANFLSQLFFPAILLLRRG